MPRFGYDSLALCTVLCAISKIENSLLVPALVARLKLMETLPETNIWSHSLFIIIDFWNYLS